MASLRLATSVPRAGLSFHSKQLQQRWLPSVARRVRYASTDGPAAERPPPPKPRVLEKPDKFRPPSHPSRIRSKPRYSYGPDLTHEQKTIRQYPHMMPPQGTFMHWFLTNRTIHLYISLGILLFLVFGIWIAEFLHNTPYQDLLPPNSMIFAHPFQWAARYIEVYDMHVAYVSAETKERRKQKVDDVQKRSDYRKAHGIAQDEGIFGGWAAKTEEESVGPALRDEDASPSFSRGVNTDKAVEDIEENAARNAEQTFVDFDGKTQPVSQKKWFGIW